MISLRRLGRRDEEGGRGKAERYSRRPFPKLSLSKSEREKGSASVRASTSRRQRRRGSPAPNGERNGDDEQDKGERRDSGEEVPSPDGSDEGGRSKHRGPGDGHPEEGKGGTSEKREVSVRSSTFERLVSKPTHKTARPRNTFIPIFHSFLTDFQPRTTQGTEI